MGFLTWLTSFPSPFVVHFYFVSVCSECDPNVETGQCAREGDAAIYYWSKMLTDGSEDVSPTSCRVTPLTLLNLP